MPAPADVTFSPRQEGAEPDGDKPDAVSEPSPSEAPEIIELLASEEAVGLRLDAYLAGQLEFSRSLLQDWIRDGRVKLGGKAAKPSARLKLGQGIRLEIPPLQPAEPQPDPTIALDVLYEDSQLLILDKPRGLVVHPAVGNPDGTLVNALLAHAPDWSGIRGVGRPGIVHRLDKHTSGLMVVAKTDQAHLGLQKQFADRTVLKIYHALVWGLPHPRRGRINQPLARDPRNRLKISVQPHGRDALTDYEVQEAYGDRASLVEVRLHTGRTHQIRVHLAWLGFPVIGDPLYGRIDTIFGLSGQALHCSRLGLDHPVSGERLDIYREPPADFQATRQMLAQSAC